VRCGEAPVPSENSSIALAILAQCFTLRRLFPREPFVKELKLSPRKDEVELESETLPARLLTSQDPSHGAHRGRMEGWLESCVSSGELSVWCSHNS